jgi:hypothetical protein
MGKFYAALIIQAVGIAAFLGKVKFKTVDAQMVPVSNQTDLPNSWRVVDRAQTAPKDDIPVSRSYACRRWSEDVGVKIRGRLPGPLRHGSRPADEPNARGADRSAGLHLFQELSTLGQQLAHTLLLWPGLRQNKARCSSASAATGPDLRRCAVPY